MAQRESIDLWSTTALTNATADPSINWGEGQLPSTVNNSARSQMAAEARYKKDTDGSLTTAGSANAYTLTINGTHTAYATGNYFVFKASFAITGAATLNITNADATALGAKAIRGPGDVALVTGQMVSGGVYAVRYDTAANSAAGAWLLLSPTEVRIPASAGLTLYVDNALGNDSNVGTASGASAKKTLQSAWDAAVNKYDFLGSALDINVADATYAAGIITTQLPLGATTIRINGNTTTPGNCFISSTTDDAFRFQVGAGCPIQIKGFKVKSTAGILVNAGFSSIIYFTDKMEFNSSSSAHIQVSNAATVVFLANYTINGNATQDHHHVINGGNLGADGMTITLSGTPSFGGAFMGAAGNSEATYTSTVFSGSGTGTRYNIHGQSFIKTANATPSTFFPGNVAGTSDGGNLDDDTGGGAWTAFSGTPTPAGGAFTASYAGRYKLISGSGGKTVVFHATITITAAGTGTGQISFAAPIGTANGAATAVARDTNVTGFTGTAFIVNGTSTFRLDKYDGATMINTGSNIEVDGKYERT